MYSEHFFDSFFRLQIQSNTASRKSWTRQEKGRFLTVQIQLCKTWPNPTLTPKTPQNVLWRVRHQARLTSRVGHERLHIFLLRSLRIHFFCPEGGWLPQVRPPLFSGKLLRAILPCSLRRLHRCAA